MNPALEAEIAYRIAHGARQLSVAQFTAEFAALGYVLDRSMDCRSMARYMAPDSESGRAYPCCTTSANEADSGLSAFNVGARRDSNFRKFQQLRGDIFAVSRGAILEV